MAKCEECPICYENVPLTIQSCNHSFCDSCILQLIKYKKQEQEHILCPLCRQIMTSNERRGIIIKKHSRHQDFMLVLFINFIFIIYSLLFVVFINFTCFYIESKTPYVLIYIL